MSGKNAGADDGADAPLAGERLAAARRDQEIPLADIARELHIDEVRVQALEQNRFEVLGAPVFAKGHLRKYAEIVGVPVDDVLADYYQLNRSAGAPPVVGPRRDAGREIDLTRWLTPAVFGFFIAAVLYWWFVSGSPLPSFGDETADPEVLQSPTRAAEPVAAPTRLPRIDDTDDIEATAAGEPEATPPRSAEATPPQSAEAATVEETVAEAPADPPATSAPPPAETSLTLAFSGDCWTEITDADGSRLFFDLGRAGRTVRVSGPPPLRVLLGNIANVDLAVDGEPYAIPPGARRGETARFTIGGR